jgi:hypothetical protein
VARLRKNNISGTASSNGITLADGSTTTVSWASAPGFPTIVAPDYYVVIAEPDTANEEIMYLTAFTSGATTGTVTRAQEGTSGRAHAATAWTHGPTAQDFGTTVTVSLTAPGAPLTGDVWVNLTGG